MIFLFIFLQRNEYIFSMVMPKTEEKGAVAEKENILESTKKRSIREDGEEKKKKKKKERQFQSNEESGRIILGLRFSRKCLHFLFKGHGGVVEHWVFRGTELADNQWHTLVLTVTSQHVRLSVDCSPPLEM